MDFVYQGHAQVPQDRLDDFIKTGDILQIRGINEGWIEFSQSSAQMDCSTTVHSSSEIQNTNTQKAPAKQHFAKRQHEEDEPSIQKGSEKKKLLLENVSELNAERFHLRPTDSAVEGKNRELFLSLKNFPLQKRQSAPAVLGENRINIEPPKVIGRFYCKSLSIPSREKENKNNPIGDEAGLVASLQELE